MSILEALILGIVQGLTEFLPVSSSGHLVLVQNIMGIEGEPLFFDTMVHVGTLVAVVVVLWKEIKELICHPIQKKMLLLIIATIPAVFVGLFLDDVIEAAFGGTWLAFGFIATTCVLILSERVSAMRRTTKEISYTGAIVMGCMQGLATLPGLSRSGSTLAGGLFCGADREKAANFSFLMSIPVILGSLVLQGYKVIKAGSLDTPWLPTLVGTLAAAVAGFFAVKFMLNLIKKRKLYGFAIYTGILGVLVLLDQALLHVVF